MASVKTHAEDCSFLLGLPYHEVHAWLDGYATSFPPPFFGEYHRSFRHNPRGVLLCQEYFGGEAALAAKIHIVRDLDRWMMRPFDTFDLDDIKKLYQKFCVEILNNPEGVFDCPLPPHFVQVQSQIDDLGFSAVMDVYNVNPERKV